MRMYTHATQLTHAAHDGLLHLASGMLASYVALENRWSNITRLQHSISKWDLVYTEKMVLWGAGIFLVANAPTNVPDGGTTFSQFWKARCLSFSNTRMIVH